MIIRPYTKPDAPLDIASTLDPFSLKSLRRRGPSRPDIAPGDGQIHVYDSDNNVAKCNKNAIMSEVAKGIHTRNVLILICDI